MIAWRNGGISADTKMLIGSPYGLATMATAPRASSGPTAPTTPTARQTWNAGWRLTNQTDFGFIPPGERRTFRARFQNQTGFAIQELALDLVQGTGSSAIYDIAVGPWSGSGNNASSWTTASVTIPAAPDGIVQPGYARRVISLPAPVANGDRFIVSIRPPGDDVVTLQGFNTNAWPAYAFPETAEISFPSDTALTASWGGGIGNVFGTLCGITFNGLSTDPCIQIAHVGDSVGEGERPFTSTPDPLSREGWYIRGNQEEIANGRRFWWNSVANGGFTQAQYLARLSDLLATDWVNGVDVVSIQVWTHNEAPANVAGAQALWADIQAAAAAVEAAGLGVIYTMLTPPSGPHQTADEIAGWQWMKGEIASLPHVYLDDLVADGSGTAIDTAYSSSDAPEPIHINQAGAILQAAALPARTATALTALGYTV